MSLKSIITVVIILGVVIVIFPCQYGALADDIGFQDLSERFYSDLQREISMWDDLGRTYENMHSSYFSNGIRIWGYRRIPYDRVGNKTGIVYYEYTDPLVFIFSRGMDEGILSLSLWGYSREWEESEFQVITSQGESISVSIKDDFVEEAGYLMSVYGPAATIKIDIHKNTRYVWLRSDNPNLLVSDIAFHERASIQTDQKKEGDLPSVDRYVLKEGDPEEDSVEAPAYKRGVTYVNERFNFSITSIHDWKQEADPEVLLLLREPETLSAFWITAHQVGAQVSLEQFISAAERDMGYDMLDSTSISTEHWDGIKRTYEYGGANISMRINMAYIMGSNKVYVLVSGTADDHSREIESQFDWMVDTFKLLDTKDPDSSSIDVPNLSHSGLVFASSFKGKRDFTNRPGAIFISGENIHVYTEISNFRAWRDENDQIMTSLSAVLKVYNEDEALIHEDEQQLRTVYNNSAALPRYTYFHFMIDTENWTDSGRFRVELTARDNISQQAVPCIGWFYISN